MPPAPMTCSNCGSENVPGRRFCGECGTALSVVCPVCSATTDAAKFCGQCGSPLPAGESPTPVEATGRAPVDPPSAPTSERRLVSVLFADLVGFTTLAESGDPDEVRDLLSRYYETCRTLIGRYGGTIEKFIGDAVMAVWGTPVAQEDDAERGVRAALELVQAVGALGQEVGQPDLQARAGVLTGEAAVTLGATGQGMVAGDLVNTASRIQAAAPPGSVFVGERTRRSTEAAVAYEPAGLHDLKGKAEPLPLWRALRVVAMRGGVLRSEGLEAPFVGRDAELRTVKDLFHASAEQRKAHMVSVIGMAGIGKSRLSWEFYKYIDGLLDTVRWHRGRCLAYGEGVTYWALAEMVRGRADIAEGEDPASARAKLRAIVHGFVTDPEERSWVESRLAHLLALEDRTAREPEDLFGAWRMFFERMAEEFPVALIFEDVQWADPSLLDFIDYLLNWSRNHPVFVMSLARPEVTERFPAWSAGRRGVSTMYLEPLHREDMEQLLQGLVPGLADAVRARILDRAEGVPLYAVETVRMLLDRGLLVQEGSVYRPVGPIEDLDVPETLHALIAARLDGLPVEQRALLQDAAVIGKTFGASALATISGREQSALEEDLSSLVRKEVLSVQADPRSPERGQYVFLQDLVRRVAYETLSKRDRKARHLAVAAYFADQREEGELAEVLAAHYLEASRAVPDAPDVGEIRAKARDALVLAGSRSESLAARREALGYYEQAAELSDEPSTKADLLARAGSMAFDAGLLDRGRDLFDLAIDIIKGTGDELAQARIEARRSFMSTADGRLEESVERLTRALDVLSKYPPGRELAEVASELGRTQFFQGHPKEALERMEMALPIAERLSLPELLSEAMDTKAIILRSQGRNQEAIGLMRHSLRIALEHDAVAAALRAYNNLLSISDIESRWTAQLEILEDGLALARKVGVSAWTTKFLSARVPILVLLGRWDEAVEAGAEARIDPAGDLAAMVMERVILSLVHSARQEFGLAEEALSAEVLEASEDVQAEGTLAIGRTIIHRYAGRYEEAVEWARRAIATKEQLGMTGLVDAAFAGGADAALAMDDVAVAEGFLAEMDSVPEGDRSMYFRAELAHLRGKVAAKHGDDGPARASYDEAVRRFRDIDMPFHAATVLASHGEWLLAGSRAEEAAPLLDEARAIFEALRATWWLDRLDQLGTGEDQARRAAGREAVR